MATVNIRPELETLVRTIGTKSTYYGNRIPESVMALIEVEVRESGGGVLAPSWLSVLERGRGKRKSSKSSNLVGKIYAWMAKRNLFKSKTPKGKQNEARAMTWYINKYGNQQFRKKVFVEVFTKAREECVEAVTAKYGEAIARITKQII